MRRIIAGISAAALIAGSAPAATPPATWKPTGPNQVACYDHLGVLQDCGGSGGGGGGAVTVADGADATQGATTDAACAGDNTSGCTIEARIQRAIQRLTTINTTTAGAVVSTTSPCASAATASCSIAAEIQLLINSTGAGVATPGSAKVASSIQMAGQDGTNAQTLLTDSAGRLKSPCDEATAKSFIVTNNTTSVAVSASGVRFCGATGYGVAASTPVWIKLYNIAQGSNTCGANTPVDRVLVATAATGNGAINPAHSVGYGTAMSVCVTAGIADADTTAPAASSYVVTIYTVGL